MPSQKQKNGSRSRTVRGSEESRPQVGILLMKKPVRLFQVTGGIYVNILRITIQAGRRNRAIWHF